MNARILRLALTALILPFHSAKCQLSPETEDLKGLTFVAFDTETTGLSPKTERIVEIGAVKFRDGQLIEKKSWLINPGKAIPKYVTGVHGIDDAMVKDAPGFAEVAPEFEAFIGDCVLVAHNAPFDVNMVSAEYQRCGRPLPTNPVIDSLKLSRKWYPELKSHKLGSMAAHLGITKGTFHRALDDSIFLAHIFIASTQAQCPPPSLDHLFEIMEKKIAFHPVEIKAISGG